LKLQFPSIITKHYHLEQLAK